MVYKEKFVSVVMSNGKILREKREDGVDIVQLPFGSEYSLKFKNLNSTRVAVSVFIDDQDVLNGSRIVVDANSDANLEGYLTGNSAKNKFKFIEKTQEISDYRGDKIGDGLIRIEYQFEKPIAYTPIIPSTWFEHPYKHYTFPPYSTSWSYNTNIGGLQSSEGATFKNDTDNNSESKNKLLGDNILRSCSFSGSAAPSACNSIDSISRFSDASESVAEGITVKGSQINQNFSNTYLGTMETEKHVIVIKLVGVNSKKAKISKAITTDARITCKTCGKRNRTNCKFCSKCGTFIE